MLNWLTYCASAGKDMASNLIKRGDMWHVRLAIPADVRDDFGGRRELQKSLKTCKKAEAELLK